MAARKVVRLNQGNNLPIGMIVHSRLTEAQFQEINGTSWILMDGRNIAGSALATLTGVTNIEDARGLVLRGKNNGRVDGNQNPDGDLAIGTFQNFKTSGSGLSGTAVSNGNHAHGSGIGSDASHGDPYGYLPGAPTGTFRYSGVTSGAKPMPYTQTTGAHTHSVSLSGGGNETAMRNLTINTFIKINP